MQLLQDFLDRSKQLNRTPCHPRDLPYHGPNKKYKIIHQALTIPNLPAPLHYLNFFTLLGQPNIPMLRNPSAIETSNLDTATVLASCSAHMVGQLNHYSIDQDCFIDKTDFHFSDREQLLGNTSKFRLFRDDSELSFDIYIRTYPIASHMLNLRFALAEHWSMPCHCRGTVQYKHQRYQIQHIGNFDFARSIHFPYVSYAFLSYQMIHVSKNRQIIFCQIRDKLNHIVQSRIFLRDLNQMQNLMLDENVEFRIQRIYPCVITPNGQRMHLVREFEWDYQSDDLTIRMQAKSRGDYKFGLAAGYVGSFQYQIQINNEHENGESGYCEYIDCRELCYQEQSEQQFDTPKMQFSQAFARKEHTK